MLLSSKVLKPCACDHMQPRAIEFCNLEKNEALDLLQECFCMCIVVSATEHLKTQRRFYSFQKSGAVSLADHKLFLSLIITTLTL